MAFLIAWSAFYGKIGGSLIIFCLAVLDLCGIVYACEIFDFCCSERVWGIYDK